MLQTLFYIPTEIAGVPMFGCGLLLAVWAVFSVAWLAWLARRQGFNSDTLSYLPLLLVIGMAIGWLLPTLSEPAGLPIRSYGVMLLIAIVSSTLLAVRRGRSMGIHPDQVLSLIFWMFVPGILGARAFYVIEYWPSFHKATFAQTFTAVVNVAQGGLVVYGSLLCGLAGLIAFAWKNRISLMVLGDLMVPSVALGMALGRVGCLLNGCCFGSQCHLPWAITFPWNSPAHVQQVQAGQTDLYGLKFLHAAGGPARISEVVPGSPAAIAGLATGQTITAINSQTVRNADDAQQFLLYLHDPGTTISVSLRGEQYPKQWTVAAPLPRSLPVHPAQLYDTINCLCLCLLLLAYDPFRRRDGELLGLIFVFYPITRFLIEVLRTDEAPIWGTGMTIAQNVSLAMLIVAVVYWGYLFTRPRKTSYAAESR
jgi:phosphatidylglycerol:prolipoprotein diacylglycerol transferase